MNQNTLRFFELLEFKFYGPVNAVNVMSSRPVNLPALYLGRLNQYLWTYFRHHPSWNCGIRITTVEMINLHEGHVAEV